ncbi:MAG: flavodoxin family protein [Caldiserica bacterium]|nr:flavodoxin family protein [Caldisericota bacterium]
MKVIGIVGSPRRGGNTDVLVEQVLAGAGAHGLETEKVLLGELEIAPCRACYSCADSGRCVIGDDFHALLEKALGSAGIVLGSPMYVGTVTAQMKAFVDRVDCSQVELVRASTGEVRFRRRHRGRFGVVVAICDLSPLSELRHCARVMEACLRDLGADTVDEVLAQRLSDVGDVRKRPELLARAFRAGERLAAAIRGGGTDERGRCAEDPGAHRGV